MNYKNKTTQKISKSLNKSHQKKPNSFITADSFSNQTKVTESTRYQTILPDIDQHSKTSLKRIPKQFPSKEKINSGKRNYIINEEEEDNNNIKIIDNSKNLEPNLNKNYLLSPFGNGKNFLTISATDDKNSNNNVGNEVRKFEYIYSPRTTFIQEKLKEEKIYQEIGIGLDPISMKIIRDHFKERLGELNEVEFITILKSTLLTWYPNLPNREQLLIRLLSRLYNEIDYNGNGHVNWEEFTKYIMISPNNISSENLNYVLKYYARDKRNIDDSEFSDYVSYAFFIEKYNLIGIVIEGKSNIIFYDGDTCKKVKATIDVKETQQNIDQMEYKQFDIKAKERLEKLEEERRIKLLIHLEQKKIKENLALRNKTLSQDSKENKKEFLSSLLSMNLSTINMNNKNINNMNGTNNISTTNNFNIINEILTANSNLGHKKERKIETPEKLKKELRQINNNNKLEQIKKKNNNKKLTILTTCFVDEFDVLFVSSSNNKISAWKYHNGSFINANKQEEDNILKDKTEFNCSIFSSILPQNSIEWEPVQKQLYTGQADGKILLWDFHQSKNIDNATLDYKKAKFRHDDDIKHHRLFNYNTISVTHEGNENYKVKYTGWNDNTNENKDDKDNQLLQKPQSNNMIIEEAKKDKQGQLFELNEKMLLSVKNDMLRESVSCLKVLGKMQILAAGYYNGDVILWDTMLKDYRKFYTDQNTGIYQIEYDTNRNLVFTCGFSHDVYIYDPFIDGCCVQKLTSHNWSINSIACNKANNEFLSIDIYGNIKIWDLDNLYNFQTINLNDESNLVKIQTNKEEDQTHKKISSNQKMIFLNKTNKILTYGEKLMVFSKDNLAYPDLCDNQAVLGCFFNMKKYLFYTVCLKKIKLWNIFNGKLQRIYDNFLPNSLSEVTAFCNDKKINRLYIGDSLGNIMCMSLSNGQIMKEFNKHEKEIIALIQCKNIEALISLSNDNVIKIQEDNEGNSIIKEIVMDTLHIININYVETYHRLIMGSLQGELRFYDLEHLKPDSSGGESSVGKEKYWGDAVTTTCILEGYPLCLCFHESSKVKFEIIPPHSWRYSIFGEFENVHINPKDNKKFKSKIMSCDFDKKNKRLYTGDMSGYINCYSLATLLDIFDKQKNSNANSDIHILDNYKVETIYSFERLKESIRHLLFPYMDPSIIIATTNDRRVKLFTADDKCTYIDDLRQISEKIKEVPIGIRYYLSDPFISKIKNNKEPLFGVVNRENIENYQKTRIKNKSAINYMRLEKSGIIDYSNKITEINAQERLYSLTKNCKLKEGKSTKWNYFPKIESMISKDEENYLKIKKLVEEAELKNSNKSKYDPIYEKDYNPKFIKEFDEGRLNDFTTILNDKIRKVKLTMSKLKSDTEKYKSFENEKKRYKNITLKTELQILFGDEPKKEFTSPRLEQLNKERAFRLGITKRKKLNNPYDYFDNYKEDFDRNILELQDTIGKKLNRRYLFTNVNYSVSDIHKMAKNNRNSCSGNENLDSNRDAKLPIIKNDSNTIFPNLFNNNNSNKKNGNTCLYNKGTSSKSPAKK